MSEPLRSKLKIMLYSFLALALGLGTASAFRWARGEAPAASLAAATLQSRPAAPATTQETGTAADNTRALAEVSRAFVAIAEKVTPGVVSITTSGHPHQNVPQRYQDLFGPFRQQPETPYNVPLGRGSGFIVSSDGYVLTNNHVVVRAEKIEVELPDGRRFDAELVGRDPTTDVAVLKIDGNNFPEVKLGNSEDLAVGEFVLAIGNPGFAYASALPFTVTAGIVSAKGRNLGIIQQAADDSPYAIEDLIQTDAVINPGNSGGPLVDSRGAVIGINTAIASATGYYQGYGFAIPINLARNVMQDLIEYGRVRRAALRVNVTQPTADDARAFGLPRPGGAVVQDFPANSPAEKAGIKRGDVIVAVDQKPVQRVGQLQSLIASYEPGAKVRVKVIRYGKEMEFPVRLAEAEVPVPKPLAAQPAGGPSNMLIGIQVSDINDQLAQEFNLADLGNVQGVIITDVAPFGPAAGAGVGRGWLIQKVDGRPIRNVKDFDDALSKAKTGDVVSLEMVAITDQGEPVHRIVNIGVPEE